MLWYCCTVRNMGCLRGKAAEKREESMRYYICCLFSMCMIVLHSVSATAGAADGFFSEDGGSRRDTTAKDFFADKPAGSKKPAQDLFKDEGGSYSSDGYLDDIEAGRIEQQAEELKVRQAEEKKQREARSAEYQQKLDALYRQIKECYYEPIILLTSSYPESDEISSVEENQADERSRERKNVLCRKLEKERDALSEYIDGERAAYIETDIAQRFKAEFEKIDAEYEKEMKYVRQQREKRKQQREDLAEQKRDIKKQKQEAKRAEQQRRQQEIEEKKAALRKKQDEKGLKMWADRGDDGKTVRNPCTCSKFIKHAPLWAQKMAVCGK